jgi:rhodanese-related sulfurtransferase
VQILLQCDQLRHDERWILNPLKVAEMLQDRVHPVTGEKAINISLTTLDSVLDADPLNHRRVFRFLSTLRSCLGHSASHKSNPRCCHLHPEPDLYAPAVLDLRAKTAFEKHHVPGSIHLPLDGLTPELAGGDLFGDPEAVFSIWNSIQSRFSEAGVLKLLEGIKRSQRAVILVCYDGDASRLGTSTLRHQGIEAFSVKGGFRALGGVVRR